MVFKLKHLYSRKCSLINVVDEMLRRVTYYREQLTTGNLTDKEIVIAKANLCNVQLISPFSLRFAS